jgi:hypothetical protein
MLIINKEANLTDALVVLNELVKLVNIQEERVLAMGAEERMSGFINPNLDTAIRVLKDLLLNTQKMRFDLGLDEYKRNIPKVQTAESAAEVQRQVYQAVKVVEEIFRRDDGTDDVVGEERTSGRNSGTEIN